MTSYLLIVNPVAGRGTGAARAALLRALLARDHPVELVETRERGHATEIARSRGAAADRVIAVGGDGTLNEVVTGLLPLGSSRQGRPALGFLPGGTANVATRAFGFTPDPNALARDLPTLEGRAVDVGIAHVGGRERPFLLWCGAGLDAVVIEELNAARTGRMGLTGLLRGAPRVLSAIAGYAAPPVHVTADGAEMPPAASVILANVAAIAFGGTVHPGASPFDGALDVVTVGRVSTLGVLAMGARMLASSLTSARTVRHRTAVSVALRGEGAVPVQIDGEPVGSLPATVRLERAAVRMLVRNEPREWGSGDPA